MEEAQSRMEQIKKEQKKRDGLAAKIKVRHTDIRMCGCTFLLGMLVNQSLQFCQ